MAGGDHHSTCPFPVFYEKLESRGRYECIVCDIAALREYSGHYSLAEHHSGGPAVPPDSDGSWFEEKSRARAQSIRKVSINLLPDDSSNSVGPEESGRSFAGSREHGGCSGLETGLSNN